MTRDGLESLRFGAIEGGLAGPVWTPGRLADPVWIQSGLPTLASMIALVAMVGALGCGDDESSATTTATTGSTTGAAGAGGTAGRGGAGGAGGSGGSGIGGAATGLELHSNTIAPDGTFPPESTCAGANSSPPLDWLPGTLEPQSYAVVLADETLDHFLHWTIWDIPAANLALPSNIAQIAEPPMPSGAKQATSYDGQTAGYLGPCPGGVEHTYRFVLHALDVATLPTVTAASSMAEVEAALAAHDLGTATLTATSDAQP